MANEKAKVVRPEDEASFQAEVEKALAYVRGVQANEVRCLSFCLIEKAPTDADPTRVRATHIVLGSQAQMAAMLASTYSAIGRSFDGEREAKEIPKESLQ